jgi:hypothetical protein
MKNDDISRTSKNKQIPQKITAITTIKRYQHCLKQQNKLQNLRAHNWIKNNT